MSKKFKSQASSARAANATFGAPAFGFGSQTAFHTSSSSLSYVAEQPDLSEVTDPNVVVSLRNLGKKDSTTKSKALEELQEHVRSTGAVEDAVIVAWIALYPRTSIDNSRRVRQLAHSLQGSFTSTAGKRIAPHLPKAVGPWLSGLYDNDRSVARSAQDALAQAFPVAEKRSALWKLYRTPLCDYAEDAILVQTTGSLSDERSTSKDDAEAKYSRVVGSAMLMLSQLIRINVDSEKANNDLAGKLNTAITNKKLWEFVYSSDSYLQRSCCSLVLLCAQHFASYLDWKTVSTCFVTKGLTSSHLGSSGPYVEALLFLTKVHPSIWTTEYHTKTAASKKLLQFLSKGSQRGLEEYWKNVDALIKVIPLEALLGNSNPMTTTDATALVAALREGLSSQEEPRQNLTAAWLCYIDVCFWFQEQLTGDETKESFLKAHPLPVVAFYIDPASSASNFPAASGLRLATSALTRLIEADLEKPFLDTWDRLVTSLLERMKLSLPESSKEFVSSQNAVVACSSRLHKLQQAVTKTGSEPISGWLNLCLLESNDRLSKESIDLLKKRNGKPFGAAAILQDTTTYDGSSNTVKDFLSESLPSLLESPSAERLVTLWEGFGQSISPLLQDLQSRPTLNPYGTKALIQLLSTASLSDLEGLAQVQKLMSESIDQSFGPLERPALISALLDNPNIKSSDLNQRLVTMLLKDLSADASPDKQDSTLKLIGILMHNSQANAALTSDNAGNQLHASLLLLADSADSGISEQASSILATFRSNNVRGSSGETRSKTLIRDQLAGAQPQLSILSLVDLALTEIQNSSEKTQAVKELLPLYEDWLNAIHPHTDHEVPLSLSITNPLQGAVYAIEKGEITRTVLRDAEDFSQLFRLTLYTSRLLSNTSLVADLDEDRMDTVLRNLPLALQYVNEKLTLESANDIWLGSTAEVLEEAADVLVEGNNVIQRLLEKDSLHRFGTTIITEFVGNPSVSYHRALTYVDIITRLVDRGGLAKLLAPLEGLVKTLHKSEKIIHSAAVLNCLKESVVASDPGRRLMNELVSDATGLKSLDLSTTSLRPLILLNIMLSEDSEPLDVVQPQRLVFLMQSLTRMLKYEAANQPILSEISKLLTALLPAVQDIYGEHWQLILDFLVSIWDQDLHLQESLPLLHSSLRLYMKLKSLVGSEDINEDLLEAWNETKLRLEEGLLRCLQLFEQQSEGTNQPREITASLLGRLLASVAVRDIIPLYRLMSSDESAVVEAAYGLLHRTIPELQEDLSLEFALGKQVIKLPPELLELLADPPNSQASAAFMKRYLLCWQLTFDHFENGSYKLKQAYVESLKESNNMTVLLDRICDIVRITDSRPVDASKFEIETFRLGVSESDSKELQWLAIHLYSRSLLFTPSLAKAWYIEQKNRTRIPLEAWTQKYISSYIVAASFDAVTKWADAQDQDDNPVTVKANVKAFEVVASMEIDPESPPSAIAVTLPSSYPLNSPAVVSRTRVAVSEKNWQSWLRTFQIIIFSTGSIIEGLIAFRRNVQGAIKGQGECAICYSIIGTDMQTPNKKCGTCKNTFHGSCLFRWFKSSNSSSCPLCRNNFNYA